MDSQTTDSPPDRWAHSPPHLFVPHITYFITGSTYRREPIFAGAARLDFLQETVMREAEHHGWQLGAWAFFANHYHIIAVSPERSGSLEKFLRAAHSRCSIEANRLDATPGRRVWFQYRDTCLTYQQSYFARLNYVFNNPVKHGLVKDAVQYPWCSAAWFHRNSTPAFRKTVQSFKTDTVNVPDDF